ncbi:MAG: protein-L-isoaspartate(D-aspartate) O-methyltransferase [Anaerolineales bacterium]
MVALLRSRGIHDPNVLQAMRKVPRERFVPPDLVGRAYGDYPLPIGKGQTISQPYIVAMMTQALEIEPGDKVLEIGTGSGYQTAILAAMGADVYSVEVVEELYESAARLLEDLGYEDVHLRLGSGHLGWPEYAPYQGIIATAAPPRIPPALIEQLDEGGNMIIPVGPQGGYQTLWKIMKRDGQIQKVDLGGVAFVPFVTPK